MNFILEFQEDGIPSYPSPTTHGRLYSNVGKWSGPFIEVKPKTIPYALPFYATFRRGWKWASLKT